MKINAKLEGVLPDKTWDTHVEIGLKARHAGDARFYLRTLMEASRQKLPNVVMLKHGQEPWTSNNHNEEQMEDPQPYKTDMEIRIYGIDRYRAKQELDALIKLWASLKEECKVYRIYRFGKDWTDV